MRKPFIGISLIMLILTAQLILSAPTQKSLKEQINPDYRRAITTYRKLETKLPREELRAITTIGILNGAKKAEEEMEQNLIEILKDLVMNTDVNDREAVLPKINKIEEQLARDQRALEVLTSAMDMAMGKKKLKDYKREMQQSMQKLKRKDFSPSLDQHEIPERNKEAAALNGSDADTDEVGRRIANLRENILKQVNIMKRMVDEKIDYTLEHLMEKADEDSLLGRAGHKMLHKRAINSSTVNAEPGEEKAEVRMINSILSEADFRKNLIDDSVEKTKDVNLSLEDEFNFDDLTKKVIASRNGGTTTISLNNNDLTRLITQSIAANRLRTSPPPPPTTTTKPLGTASIVATTQTNRPTTINKGVITITIPTLAPITTTPASLSSAIAITTSSETAVDGKPVKQEAASPELFGDDGPIAGGGGGGLVGIITSLSGGEGGSDIGALIGALTGVIAMLFGPGGLDVESLISSGSSLIAGLLAGNKNFGTVLGNYVGLALDGLSGGGGAVNNGQFFGNFLGTVVAALSIDPEEDDEPLRPLLFLQNVVESFMEAKNRRESDEDTGERKSGGSKKKKEGMDGGSSGKESGAFIQHIVSHIVSSAVGFVLNASVGSSGGSSHASSSLFAGSSHGHGVKH